ncbi:hypothetical protein FA13DRAFT_15027 [Coprinellus micaceus]|uniref:Uncharacterized protein n=1 Tax=Coprinellus micaceus TaxID=71717 RepID=A0A4Y7TZP0_COPMI|nr:hypothetical protein FA13DRAFT_15027 [Coprinellus micaceus]
MPHFQVHAMTFAPARLTENMAPPREESRGRLRGVDGSAARLPETLFSELGVCLMDPFLPLLFCVVYNAFCSRFAIYIIDLCLKNFNRLFSRLLGRRSFLLSHHHLLVEDHFSHSPLENPA